LIGDWVDPTAVLDAVVKRNIFAIYDQINVRQVIKTILYATESNSGFLVARYRT
jgi:hypothetical protein